MMDDLTLNKIRWVRYLALAVTLIGAAAAAWVALREQDAARFYVGGAAAALVIAGAWIGLVSHGDSSPRGVLRDCLAKGFTFAGAAPGVLLLIAGLASSSIPDAPEPPSGGDPAIYNAIQALVGTQQASAAAAAAGAAPQVLIGVGVGAVLIILAFFALWVTTHRKPPSKQVQQVQPVRTVLVAEKTVIRRAPMSERLSLLGVLWALAIAVVFSVVSRRR